MQLYTWNILYTFMPVSLIFFYRGLEDRYIEDIAEAFIEFC